MEQPIMFSNEMVQALLAGRKTETRRIIRPQPPQGNYEPSHLLETDQRVWVDDSPEAFKARRQVIPFKLQYEVGQVLWVKEAFVHTGEEPDGLHFKASATWQDTAYLEKRGFFYQTSVSMPRQYARIFLKVTAVRVERLQDITLPGIIAEGWNVGHMLFPRVNTEQKAFDWFKRLWDSYNRDHPSRLWVRNPYVAVIQFEKMPQKNG